MSQRAYMNGMDVVWRSPNSPQIQQIVTKRRRPQSSANISPIIRKKPSAGPKDIFKFIKVLQKINGDIHNQNTGNKTDDNENTNNTKQDAKAPSCPPTEMGKNTETTSFLAITNGDKFLEELKPSKLSAKTSGTEIISNVVPINENNPFSSPPQLKCDSSDFSSVVDFNTNQNSFDDSIDDFLCSVDIDKIIEQSQTVQKDSAPKKATSTVTSSEKYHTMKNKSYSESELIKSNKSKLKLGSKIEIEIEKDSASPKPSEKDSSEGIDSPGSTKYEVFLFDDDFDANCMRVSRRDSIDDIMCSLNTDKIIEQSQGNRKEMATSSKSVPNEQDSRK